MNPLATDRAARTAATMQRVADLCCDPRKHCALVLAANLGLVGCGLADPFSSAVLLHAVLLPVNSWRLLRALRAGPPAAVRAAAAARDEAAALKRLAAQMRCQRSVPTAMRQTVRLGRSTQG